MTQNGTLAPRTPDPEELSLIQRIKNQEREAFAVLVKKFSGRIFRQAFLILGSPREVEDAVQEVFVKAYLAMGQYRGGSLFGWLATITHHHCVDLLRKSRQEVPKDENPLELLLSVAPQKEVDSIGEILSKLGETEREVVQLRVIEGLEYSEVAEITGLAEGTLRNILYRSLRKLREEGATS